MTDTARQRNLDRFYGLLDNLKQRVEEIEELEDRIEELTEFKSGASFHTRAGGEP
jgi:hypothetical protein